jgi:hypothetical protein
MASSQDSKEKGQGKGGESWTRASEVNDAMLGLQPYADDSMLFIMRYSHKAQVVPVQTLDRGSRALADE